MKRIDTHGRVFRQTSVYVPENIYSLAKREKILLSESLEEALIKKLQDRGIEIEEGGQ
jgi:hypothetical protein